MSEAGTPAVAPVERTRFAFTPMLVVALLGAPLPLGLMVWFSLVAPEFAKMFADFGGPLPFATALVLSPAWAPGMVLAYLLLLPLPMLLLRHRAARDFATLAIVLLGLLAVMASAALLYLPLFALAPALQP